MISDAFKKKTGKVFKEFGKGKLRSGSKTGPIVTNPKQATAIALNSARKAVGGIKGGLGNMKSKDLVWNR